LKIGEFEFPDDLVVLARSREDWWSPGRAFKKAFYGTLLSLPRGLGEERVDKWALRVVQRLLNKEAWKIHGLTDAQVYALVGLTAGIVRIEGGVAQLRCFRPAGSRARRSPVDDVEADEWTSLTQEMLADKDRPQRAAIDAEIEWVGSQLRVAADSIQWGTCPSQLAGNLLLDLREPEYATLRMKFWSLLLEKRLSPGDAVGKRKAKSTLDEGAKAEDAAVDEEALKRRLGMMDESRV